MPHAEATLGTTNYLVAINAGHHELKADEGLASVGIPSKATLVCPAIPATGRSNTSKSISILTCDNSSRLVRTLPSYLPGEQ